MVHALCVMALLLRSERLGMDEASNFRRTACDAYEFVPVGSR